MGTYPDIGLGGDRITRIEGHHLRGSVRHCGEPKYDKFVSHSKITEVFSNAMDSELHTYTED